MRRDIEKEVSVMEDVARRAKAVCDILAKDMCPTEDSQMQELTVTILGDVDLMQTRLRDMIMAWFAKKR